MKKLIKESEIYLNEREHAKTLILIVSGIPYKELGVQWVAKKSQYQITDKKRWFLSKIKYGI
jgi:hypothetical protein